MKISKNDKQWEFEEPSTKTQYLADKSQACIHNKNEKFSSWKAFCDLTPPINPWNEIYNLAAGKRKLKERLTILIETDGVQTKETADTLRHILEHFSPEEGNNDDDVHERARLQSQLQTSMTD